MVDFHDLLSSSSFICLFQLTKHVALRRHPSLELPMILIFAFLPYFIAEGLNLSGVVLYFNVLLMIGGGVIM